MASDSGGNDALQVVRRTVPTSLGLIVSSSIHSSGGFVWAEVLPAPLRHWRPWRNRTARWWFEVHSSNPAEDWGTTHAYDEGGSGGAFTLARCINRAADAVDKIVIETYQEWSDSGRNTTDATA